MCLRARLWGFVIGCPRFRVVVKVGSPAMMMSIFLERLFAIVFGVISVGSSGSRLSHGYIAVRGSCVGYCWCSCASRCCTTGCASGLFPPMCRFGCGGLS